MIKAKPKEAGLLLVLATLRKISFDRSALQRPIGYYFMPDNINQEEFRFHTILCSSVVPARLRSSELYFQYI